jgi:hypothetical protein
MKVYKVSNNFHKKIREIEVVSINSDISFETTAKFFMSSPVNPERVCTLPFKAKYPNEPNYFIKYEDAKEFKANRIKNKIEKLTDEVNSCMAALNDL